MDAELEFAIQPSTTGKQLFDQVCYVNFTLESVLVMPLSDNSDTSYLYHYASSYMCLSCVELLNYKLFGMPAGFQL